MPLEPWLNQSNAHWGIDIRPIYSALSSFPHFGPCGGGHAHDMHSIGHVLLPREREAEKVQFCCHRPSLPSMPPPISELHFALKKKYIAFFGLPHSPSSVLPTCSFGKLYHKSEKEILTSFYFCPEICKWQPLSCIFFCPNFKPLSAASLSPFEIRTPSYLRWQ